MSLQYSMENFNLSEEMFHQIVAAVSEVEKSTGKVFGDTSKSPLILCVRAGALVSTTDQAHTSIGAPESWKVPGVMTTLLGLGMNDAVVECLAGNWNIKSSLNAYAHFLMSFGMLIFGVPSARYHNVIHQVANINIAPIIKSNGGPLAGETGTGTVCESSSYNWTAEDLILLIEEFKKIQQIPCDAWTQLKLAISKMYSSWFSDTSTIYRDNLDMYRGSGVAIIVNEQVLSVSCIYIFHINCVLTRYWVVLESFLLDAPFLEKMAYLDFIGLKDLVLS